MRIHGSLFLSFLLFSTLYAQEDSTLSLEELLSVNLTTGSFLDLDLSQSPLSITIIDKQKISLSGARHLSELLEIYVPGFQYMYNRWNGIIWGMRGVASDRNTKILFLMNGHKLNMESRDGAMSEISLGLLNDIERVEVLRGPAGLVYGSGAIAGVVNIVTRRYQEETNLDRASIQLGTYNIEETSVDVQGTVHKQSENASYSVDFGYRKSDGVGNERSRIYGKGGWPFPYWLDNPPRNGALSNGSAQSTPGNYKLGIDWEYRGIRWYTRITHQVDNASGMFVLDPWPNTYGSPDSYSSNTWVLDTISRYAIHQGEVSRPSKGYQVDTETKTIRVPVNGDTVAIRQDTAEIWMIPASQNPSNTTVDGQVENGNSWYSAADGAEQSRRQYVIDNLFSELSYTFQFGQNQLRIKGAVDAATDRIQLEHIRGYESEYSSERTSEILETFGERRLTFSGTYLFNSIAKMQMATGYEWRMDQIGDDLDGQNFQNEFEDHYIVSDIRYYNHALFLEGLFNVLPQIDFHAGVRWDGHSRTMDQRDEIFHVPGIISPKLSLLFYPMQGHTIKAIFQSSANNGSADNYEYNRNSVDNNGTPFTSYHFERPYDYPDLNAVPIAGVSSQELHELKPERSWSWELATYHHMLNDHLVCGTSISYNTINNLFTWNQAQFRVINAGEYHFVTAELEASYTRKRWSVGANHAFQQLVNTDVEAQEIISMGPVFDRTKDWFDTLQDEHGKTYYVPEPTSYSDTIRINPIKDQISVDGKYFLNLAPHITKIYAQWEFIPDVTIHSDVRIFWGLLGRDDLYNYKKTSTIIDTSYTFDTTYIVQEDESVLREIDTLAEPITTSSSNHSYLDDRDYSNNTIFNTLGIEKSPMVKWDISLHWTPGEKTRISFFVYDVLGTDRGNGSDSAIHTLRWQQTANSKEQTDLYGTDLRSYAIRVERSF